MALLRKGHKDINTEDPALINAAVDDLKQLYNICNIKVGDLQYETIPENKAWLNQAWSGDMMSGYFYYLPNKQTGTLSALLEPRLRQVARSRTTCGASARPPRSRCWRTSSSTTCWTTGSPTRTSSTSTATSRR